MVDSVAATRLQLCAHSDGSLARRVEGDERAHEVVQTASPDAAPPVIHMPSPSYWPLTCAAGLAIMPAGLLVADFVGNPTPIPIFLIAGLFVLIGSIYGWAYEPA